MNDAMEKRMADLVAKIKAIQERKSSGQPHNPAVQVAREAIRRREEFVFVKQAVGPLVAKF
jgi:hypothetical protein